MDFGLRRVGLAVSDPLKLIAGPLAVLPPQEVLRFLTDYMKREPVDVLVVGEPLNWRGQPNAWHGRLRVFVQQVQQLFPHLRIERQDERYTSAQAQRILRSSGLSQKQRQQKERTDQISAVLILQQYLEKQPK